MVSIFCEYLVLFLLDMSLALSLNPFLVVSPLICPPQSSWFLPPALLSCASFLLLLLLYKSCAPSLGQVDRSHLSGYHAVCECLCGLSFGFQCSSLSFGVAFPSVCWLFWFWHYDPVFSHCLYSVSEIACIQVPCIPKLCILGIYPDGFSANSKCKILIKFGLLQARRMVALPWREYPLHSRGLERWQCVLHYRSWPM